ncbi:hypothetical protein NHN26_12920 [Rhodovulum tesquicola]|uniref:hypothetical protein n=1 Tax=Rhodovulum tesquicola TaxID=540254 RepID=UPI0020986067|nr:hypothetical protein [Rhodovulum tesquicola]MCO8146123.1 hypothetical protein [Rhodovulum tesquicola]
MPRGNMRRRMIGLAVLAFAVAAEPDPLLWITGEGVVKQAEARVGRPATPVSAAGVARRTTRRIVRRTTVYIATLPAGCVTVTINGASYYQCGATYYQPYGGQYVVVVID